MPLLIAHTNNRLGCWEQVCCARGYPVNVSKSPDEVGSVETHHLYLTKEEN